MMKKGINDVFEQLRNDLKLFIDLALQEGDDRWQEWCSLVQNDRKIDVSCWEKKGCNKDDCPCYMNASCRCWLTVGTMCGGEVQGTFARKYISCMECSVYRDIVYRDSTSEAEEHLIIVVHTLRQKQLELKQVATRDMLTGLYNRNYFNIFMEKEIEKINRYGGSLAIVIIDIDNFKYINDTYGHLHGDGIIRECASIISRAARSSDHLVRFGGDEFVIVMIDADCTEKEALISRITRNISDWNNKYGSRDYQLSMSIGCSAYTKGSDLETVLGEADAEMYTNKRYKREC